MVITENFYKDFAIRVFVYLLGCITISFGVIFMLRSDIGLSTWDTLHFALHKLTGITIGTATIVVAITFTVIIIVMNKSFRYVLMTIPIFLVGWLIDVINFNILDIFTVVQIYTRIPTYIVGLLLLPLGGSLLIISKFPAGVFDEFTLAMMRILKTKNLIKTRVIIEIAAVATALIIGLFAGIGLGQISFGTIIFSLTVGTFLKLYLTIFERIGLYETEQND